MNSKTVKELRRITENIPKELTDRLVKEKYEAPAVRTVINKALKDPDVDDELKRRLQLVKDAGFIDKKVETVNRTAEKEIDKWVQGEIEKAIKLGRIPHPKHDKELQKYYKKAKKNDKKRNNKK